MSKVDTALALYEIYKALGGEGEIEGYAVNTPSLLLAISELVGGGGGGGGEGVLYVHVDNGLLDVSYNDINAAIGAKKDVILDMNTGGSHILFRLKELYYTDQYYADFEGSNGYHSADADTYMGENLG